MPFDTTVAKMVVSIYKSDFLTMHEEDEFRDSEEMDLDDDSSFGDDELFDDELGAPEDDDDEDDFGNDEES